MGSDSDLPTMEPAAAILRQLGVTVEVRVLSAHRTPLEMVAFAEQARGRGYRVIVAGAGGAAHLPGMVAALTLDYNNLRGNLSGWHNVSSLTNLTLLDLGGNALGDLCAAALVSAPARSSVKLQVPNIG